MDEAQHPLADSPKGGSVEGGKAAGAVKEAKNHFLELLPMALSELRHTLSTSKNERLRVEVAESIVEKAGAGGGPKTAPVVINDSNVQLLISVAREVFEP